MLLRHLPRDPALWIEVFAAAPLRPDTPCMLLSGTWHCIDDGSGWRYQLRDARLLATPGNVAHPGFTRRQAISGGALLGLSAWIPLAACTSGKDAIDTTAERTALSGFASVDFHSHAGSIISLRHGWDGPFSPVAAPMREGGMAVICLTIAADSPATRITEDRRVRPFRDPVPGELYTHGQRSFQRAHAMVKSEGLAVSPVRRLCAPLDPTNHP